MSKILVDTSTCVGCSLCEQSCPEVFKVKEDGLAYVMASSCKDHSLAEVAQACPVSAIKIV